MKRMLTLLLAAASILFFSNIIFARDVITKTYDYKDFSEVEASSGMVLTVTQSNSYSIEVKIDSDDLKYFRVEQKGNKVEFYLKNNFFSFFGHRHGRIEINIKMPALTGVGLSGGASGNITMDIPSKNFSGELSGGANLKGNLTCRNAKLGLSGGCGVNLSGKGDNLRIEGSGGCTFKLKDFSVNNVDTDLSGGTNATVTMNGTLNAEQSGGSRLTYYGKATLGNTDFSGGSGVSKGK